MQIWQAALLGLVQGLCEFLPVSSSGHLSLMKTLLGVDAPGVLMDTMLHVGTLAALLWVYRKDVWNILRHPLHKPLWLLVVATIPAVVAALLFGDFFETAFTGAFLGVSFLLTTLLLLLGQYLGREHRIDVGWREALTMGLFQAVAILPGVSRSGSTISGGLLCGLPREKAARFSFLMSMPAIFGSVVFQAKDLLSYSSTGENWLPIAVGMLVAAVSSFFAIRLMLKIIRKAGLKWFALYTGALGVLVLFDQLVTHFFF